MKILEKLDRNPARLGAMQGRRLIEEAEAAERMAQIVSYGPDKQRLKETAQRLRAQAQASAEPRSWAPRNATRR